MNNIASIRKALEAALLQIKETDGYSVTLSASNIKTKMRDMIAQQNTNSALYPKIIVMLDGGDVLHNPASSYELNLSFLIVAIFINRTDDDAAQVAAENFADDCIRLFRNNGRLGEAADDVRVNSMTTDTGAVAPEAVTIIRLDVTKVVIG